MSGGRVRGKGVPRVKWREAFELCGRRRVKRAESDPLVAGYKGKKTILGGGGGK